MPRWVDIIQTTWFLYNYCASFSFFFISSHNFVLFVYETLMHFSFCKFLYTPVIVNTGVIKKK